MTCSVPGIFCTTVCQNVLDSGSCHLLPQSGHVHFAKGKKSLVDFDTVLKKIVLLIF